MKIILSISFILLFSCFGFSQNSLSEDFFKSELNLKSSEGSDLISQPYSKKSFLEKEQFKKEKTVNSYFGAGYSFVIFTNSKLNSLYPLFDTRSGSFLSEVNLFYGFAIAKAVSLEFEPSFLFTSSSKNLSTELLQPHTPNGTDTIVISSNIGMFAIPFMVNARFFPFYKMSKSFARLFFLGGGAGAIWIKEDYDNFYTSDPNNYYTGYYYGGITESTSQWQPMFRVMLGFTGTGGQFGFGGEVRYNIVPLTQENNVPFVTRISPNFNSIDIVLRGYFSL